MWGAWWAYNVCLAVLKANHSRPYAAQPWFRMGLKRFYWMEPLLKIILPPLAVSVELYFDHTAFRWVGGWACQCARAMPAMRGSVCLRLRWMSWG